MRQENVNIRIEIPVNYNEPDRNGVIYTKEAIKEAVFKADEDARHKQLPLLTKPGDMESCIGMINSVDLFESWSRDCGKIILNGIAFAAGNCENGIVENYTVKSFEITSFGIGK